MLLVMDRKIAIAEQELRAATGVAASRSDAVCKHAGPCARCCSPSRPPPRRRDARLTERSHWVRGHHQRRPAARAGSDGETADLAELVVLGHVLESVTPGHLCSGSSTAALGSLVAYDADLRNGE
jgi:hypothetical protein